MIHITFTTDEKTEFERVWQTLTQSPLEHYMTYDKEKIEIEVCCGGLVDFLDQTAETLEQHFIPF